MIILQRAMRPNKLVKIIASLLIFGQLAGWPVLAFAQVPGVGALNPIPVNDGGNVAQNAAYEAAMAVPRGAYQVCLETVNAADIADTGAQLGFSGLSLIGGDAALLTRLGAKISAYQAFITCANLKLAIMQGVPAGNVFTANKKQELISQVNAAIITYKTKLEQTQARYNNANQGFWKTLVFNILIKTSKAVANALVTKLVNNYKIRDYKQYADSLATLTYDNQFIRQNFPDAQGQLMARAILENPSFRYQVPPGIFVAADAALGFDPKGVNPNDPFFYAKMASVGSSQANPYYQHSVMVGGVDQAKANSLAYAQGNILQSQGLKAPVNCAGTLAQQQAIDGQTKALSDKLADREALLNSFEQAQSLNQPINQAAYQKAKADYQAALTSWNNSPDALGKNNAAIIMCEAIVAPSTLIDKGINEAFKSVGSKLGQYDSNNLPGFINIIGDVASQIGSSLIFGGVSGAKGALLINEGRVVNGAVEAANEAVYAKTSENLAKGINFGPPEPDSNTADGYTLSWEIITQKISTASFVTISGDGISSTKTDPVTKATVPNKLPLSGNYSITTKTGGTYIITVFDVNGRALTSGSTILKPVAGSSSPAGSASGSAVCGGNYSSLQACINQVGDASYCTSVCGTVQGAFTNKPSLDIRGPAVSLGLRGQ